ncbi:MAG: hypothetical protein RL299_1307 [Pseudomonadota bacterium]|jgi:putative NADH-flavin reductase
MRVLIIGATGNSGLALTKMALARGHHVTGYVRNADKLRELLGLDGDSDRLTIKVGTLANREAMAEAMAGQEAVINAAGNAVTDPNYITMVQSVIAPADQMLSPGGRFWLFGGAAALDVPGHNLRAADLPLIPKIYVQHLSNLARIEQTRLDWSMLCPGPMVPSATGEPHEGLRVSADSWPVEGPGQGRLFRTIRILKAFKQRMPEMIVAYEDAAQIILDNLEPNGPYSRRRVGLALPVGMTGSKPQAY